MQDLEKQQYDPPSYPPPEFSEYDTKSEIEPLNVSDQKEPVKNNKGCKKSCKRAGIIFFLILTYFLVSIASYHCGKSDGMSAIVQKQWENTPMAHGKHHGLKHHGKFKGKHWKWGKPCNKGKKHT